MIVNETGEDHGGKHTGSWGVTPEGQRNVDAQAESQGDAQEALACSNAWRQIAPGLHDLGTVLIKNPDSKRARDLLASIQQSLDSLRRGKDPILDEQDFDA